MWNVVLLVFLILYTGHKRFDGEVFLFYLAGYGIGRFWIESLRTDQLLLPGIGYPVSKVVALVLIALSLGWILLYRLRHHSTEAPEQKIQEQ
jgi:phosphatidylglycerol:prolipoprotein diacylglycerol transferase